MSIFNVMNYTCIYWQCELHTFIRPVCSTCVYAWICTVSLTVIVTDKVWLIASITGWQCDSCWGRPHRVNCALLEWLPSSLICHNRFNRQWWKGTGLSAKDQYVLYVHGPSIPSQKHSFCNLTVWPFDVSCLRMESLKVLNNSGFIAA